MWIKDFTYRDAITFTRLTVIGFTWTLPLLGNLVAHRSVVPRQLFLLLSLATAFHIFAYVTNDIIDLDLDRLVPRRATKPLIRGAISQQQALWIALGQLPLMFLLNHFLRGDFLSVVLLFLSLLGMGLYNLFGKKTRFPILTDFIQGVSWALLVIYGNWVAGPAIAPASYWIAGFVIIYIMLINGIHGSIRDLPTDAAYGVRSTAILLGATFVAPDKIYLSLKLCVYAAFLQCLLVGLSVVTFVVGSAATRSLSIMLALAILSCLTCGLFLFLLIQKKIPKLSAIGTLQAIGAYWCIMVAVLHLIGAAGFSCLLFVYFAPMLFSDWLFRSFSGELDLKTVPAAKGSQTGQRN